MKNKYNTPPPNPSQPQSKNFEQIFNSSSSFSLSHENSLRPKYFDRLGHRTFENSDLDLKNGVSDEILNATNFRGSDTSNQDLTMLNTLNFLKTNQKNHQESASRAAQNNSHSKNVPPNYRNPNSAAPRPPMVQNSPVNLQSPKAQREAVLSSKMMEINQILSSLIPFIEQRKMDLLRKTSHISSKDRNRSCARNQSLTSKSDHTTLKALAKIRKDSTVFNVDGSEESDDETKVINIFNNNMSYLNSTLTGIGPGRLIHKYTAKNSGNMSMPVNYDTSVSVAYNNKSAGPGLYYVNSGLGRSQNKSQNSSTGKYSEYGNRTTNEAWGQNGRRGIFDKNRSTRNDERMRDERICKEFSGYYDGRNAEVNREDSRRKDLYYARDEGARKRGANGRK